MARYKYNVFRDTLRLLRATVAGSTADPFIMSNPRAVTSRSTLFHWSSISDRLNASQPDFLQAYSPYVSCQPLLFDHLPEVPGREAFEHMTELQSVRCEIFSRLLKLNGLAICAERDCWEAIDRWVSGSVEASEQTLAALPDNPSDNDLLRVRGEHFLQPVWQSIIIDLSLLMASQAQEKRPELAWVFWADAGIDDGERFGRSPWFMDGRNLPLAPDSTPSRVLLVTLVTGAVQMALCRKLQHKGYSKETGLANIFTTLSSLT
ncbi:MAG: hypothetical protein AB8B87_18235 [Granulosicoccus sp.]